MTTERTTPTTKEGLRKYKKDWESRRWGERTDKKEPECKNMNFFVSIIHSLNLNYKQVSIKTGISQQLISFWLRTDDCKYSRILEVFDKLGMKIECNIIADTPKPIKINREKFSINIVNLPDLTNKAVIEKTSPLARTIGNNLKLKFFAEYIERSGYNLVDYCAKVKMPYYTVYNWFEKDDIKISSIYELTEKTGHKITWNLSKKED